MKDLYFNSHTNTLTTPLSHHHYNHQLQAMKSKQQQGLQDGSFPVGEMDEEIQSLVSKEIRSFRDAHLVSWIDGWMDGWLVKWGDGLEIFGMLHAIMLQRHRTLRRMTVERSHLEVTGKGVGGRMTGKETEKKTEYEKEIETVTETEKEIEIEIEKEKRKEKRTKKGREKN